MDKPIDVIVQNEGNIFLFRPKNDTAREWINVFVADPVYFAGSLVVDHHYAAELAAGMVADGLVLV